MEKLNSIKDNCAHLGCGKEKFRLLRKTPGFPAPIYIGKRPRWSAASIQEWVEKQAANAAPGVNT